MTNRALAHRPDAAVGVGEGCDAYDRVQLEKRNRVHVHLRPTDNAVFGETPGPTPPFFAPGRQMWSYVQMSFPLLSFVLSVAILVGLASFITGQPRLPPKSNMAKRP
jgi:hypothetical protein